MPRSFKAKLILAALFVTSVAIADSASAQTSTISYDVQFSELFPERAAKYREHIRQTRASYDAQIRGARTLRERERMIVQANELMRELNWQIALECPATTFVIQGGATPDDVDIAKAKLRSGALTVGGTVYIRGYRNPASGGAAPAGSAARPWDRVNRRPQPKIPSKQKVRTRDGALGRKTTTNPAPQRQKDANVPGFDDLHFSGGGVVVPGVRDIGTTGVLGID